MRLLLFSLLFGTLFSMPEAPSPKATLVLNVNNINKSSGRVWVGLYKSEDHFLDREKAILVSAKVTAEGNMKVHVPNLMLGTYAIAVFHDENDNGELDRNLLGIPSEPFSFVRKPKSKWRLPKFDEVALQFQQPNQVIQVSLKKWWKL